MLACVVGFYIGARLPLTVAVASLVFSLKNKDGSPKRVVQPTAVSITQDALTILASILGVFAGYYTLVVDPSVMTYYPVTPSCEDFILRRHGALLRRRLRDVLGEEAIPKIQAKPNGVADDDLDLPRAAGLQHRRQLVLAAEACWQTKAKGLHHLTWAASPSAFPEHDRRLGQGGNRHRHG